MTEKPPNLMRDMNINITRISSKMNSERPISRHIIKLLKTKDKENLESSKREIIYHIQGILNKIVRFLIRNFGARRQWAWM